MKDIPNFIDILDEVLVEESEEKKKKTYDYRHNPSSASFRDKNGKVIGACLRQLWYKAMKEPVTEDLNVTSAIQAGFGDAIHGWLLDKLAKSPKIKVTKETGGKFLLDPLTYEISYRLDGLIGIDEEEGGLEIKTTQGQALTGNKNFKGIKDKGPKDDHILQVICYMKAKPHLKWFSIVYIARDNAYRVQFDIRREKDVFFLRKRGEKDWTQLDFNFDGVLDRWVELEKYVEDNKLPPRDYKVWLKADGTIQETKYKNGQFLKSDYRCIYCPYAQKCWSEKDASKDSYK